MGLAEADALHQCCTKGVGVGDVEDAFEGGSEDALGVFFVGFFCFENSPLAADDGAVFDVKPVLCALFVKPCELFGS